MGIAAICTVSSFALHRLQYNTILFDNDGTPQHQHRHRHRSLGISDYKDPKSIVDNDNAIGDSASPPSMSIHFYIKTSGQERFLTRAKHIADTWGKEVMMPHNNGDATGNVIQFLFDNQNQAAVEDFARDRPWVQIRHVEDTDGQGGYKGKGRHNEAQIAAAFRAQRLKTRAVFINEFSEVDTPAAEWVCYLDDDMVVNGTNLQRDLREKAEHCTPNCLIADGNRWKDIQYTAGGWCMNHQLAYRTYDLLQQHTDEELQWESTDDVSFNYYVMFQVLGVLPTNSDRWRSELHSRSTLRGMSVQAFSETVVPTLAVYHSMYVYG